MVTPLSAERHLRQQHAELTSIAAEIRQTMRLAPANLAASLSPLRMRLATALRTHLADEQALLLDHLKGPLRDRVPMLDTVTRRATALRLAYSNHVATWTGRAVEADPLGYAAASDRLLAELQVQIAFEERDLFVPAFAALRRLPIAC